MLLIIATCRLAFAEDDQPFALPVSTHPDHIDFTADHFDYDRSSSTVHLQGNVWIKQSTGTIKSNELWIDTEKKRARGYGYVEMDNQRSLLYGRSGEFDLDTGEGYLKDASATFAPWRIHGSYAKRDLRQDISFRHAWFTSCNKDPHPHYYFRSSYLKARPNEWFYSWNDLFYLDGVPVFYLPFFWKSLRKEPWLRTSLHYGDDHRNGANVQTRTLFNITSSVLGKVLLDYYTRAGIGYGSEMQYVDSKNRSNHGALFAYRITEKQTGLNRWTFQGDDYQSLLKGYAFQLRLQAQSDPTFGNDYSRSSSLAVTPQLINSGALVHNASWGTTRVSYSREDDANTKGIYLKTTETAPEVDYNSPAVKLWKLPWLNTFSGSAANTFTAGSAFIQKSVASTWGMTRTFPIRPGFSFVPSLALSETYLKQDAYSDAFANSRTFYDSFTGRYTLGGDFRKSTPIGYLDLAHTYTRRMRPDVLVPDVLGTDRGVEANATSLSDILMIRRSLFLHVLTGYTFQTFRNQTIWWEDRVTPLTSDLNWTPYRYFTMQVRDQYQIHTGGQAAALQADLGERGGKFLGLGFENNLSSASYYIASEELGWRPSSGTWSASLVFRTIMHSVGGLNFNMIAAYVKELWIKKDFHDFHTQLMLRERPGNVKEAMVFISLKFEAERPVVQDLEKAPWRTWSTQP